MAESALPLSPAAGPVAPGWAQRAAPVAAVLTVVLLAWYGLAVWLNAPGVIERVLAPAGDWGGRELLAATWNAQRPVVPTPHQIGADLWSSWVDWPLDSPRSLALHTWVTGQATLTGFVLGTALGVALAACIVHSRTLDRALLPWIVASQTVPVLAIAPIVLVILGSLGFSGLLPKAVIAMYLCFFPVTVAMVQGLRSPQRLEMELMHTYAASRIQTFWLLRLPAALPFLFPALRVSIAAGLVGAIVAELPTGAQAGLGARLLTGSYYGNTVQIWSALVMASVLGLALTGAIGLLERSLTRRTAPRRPA
ncbi:ABC transporter permease [Ideonella livida]|uniref:ABC transporter permease n=1 Tax=Ideonella livida TaxID=2707176 RepID=A0A7C9THG2_9BURK|nr:ABC transporter permease [Ideonella livida]NDY90460.1 ABC transporter permease [Ideonella livida]